MSAAASPSLSFSGHAPSPSAAAVAAAAVKHATAAAKPVVATILAVVVTETLLFGVLLLLVGVHVYLRARQSTYLTWTMAATALALFSLCSAHWTLTILAFFYAILNRSASEGAVGILGIFEFYVHQAKTLEFVRVELGFLTMLLGSFIQIYRMWVLWGRNIRVAVVPAAMWVAQFGTGLAISLIVLRDLSQNSSDYFESPLFIIVWACMLGINIICTTFTSWRILTTTGPVSGSRGKRFKGILVVLLESYAVMIAWLIAFIIAREKQSASVLAITDLTPQVIGLVHFSIHIRLGFSGKPPSRTGVVSALEPSRGMVFTTVASIMGAETMETIESKWV